MDISDLQRHVLYDSLFANDIAFKAALARAQTISRGTLIPIAFREEPENCLMALELANAFRISVAIVMQHITFIEGKVGWDAQFVISRINTCGRYDPLKYEFDGEGEDYGCRAYTIERSTKEKLYGPKVDFKMVRAEGWDRPENSKWRTMPDVMFPNRAGTFWGRRHCPELVVGMRIADELEDIVAHHQQSNSTSPEPSKNSAAFLNSLLTQSIPDLPNSVTDSLLMPIEGLPQNGASVGDITPSENESAEETKLPSLFDGASQETETSSEIHLVTPTSMVGSSKLVVPKLEQLF